MKKPLRDKKGRFTTIAPIGTMGYFSRIEPTGEPSYCSGWYIVTGVGKKGVVSCVPYTTSPTKSHMYNFTLIGKNKMHVSNAVRMTSTQLNALSEALEVGIMENNNQNPAYYDIARHAIAQLILASKIVN